MLPPSHSSRPRIAHVRNLAADETEAAPRYTEVCPTSLHIRKRVGTASLEIALPSRAPPDEAAVHPTGCRSSTWLPGAAAGRSRIAVAGNRLSTPSFENRSSSEMRYDRIGALQPATYRRPEHIRLQGEEGGHPKRAVRGGSLPTSLVVERLEA